MEQTFLTGIHINKIRHLSNIYIPLSADTRKNLIFTGKNGSGKTSVLEKLADCIFYAADPTEGRDDIEQVTTINPFFGDITISCISIKKLEEKYRSGQLILAYFEDLHRLIVDVPNNVVKITPHPFYNRYDKPSRELVRYMVSLKATQAFAKSEKNSQRAKEIEEWFQRFENILRLIYDNNSLKLNFDIETFQFIITIDGLEPFDFNTMSMGYAAVFDIISDLMMRMESQHRYDLEGIVLIDEIETHLHVELQKKIVPILIELFPNIQFIMTTHSPFVLNSAPNAVVYDLEKHMLVENGLTNLPYEGIVEGYFGADLLSQELREKFEKYRKLVQKSDLTDEDFVEAAELEMYLDEVPDYLALGIATEYSRLKLEFANKG